MSDFEWNPEIYLAQMLDEIPGYEDLQDAVAAAAEGVAGRDVLELGTGTGETAARVLARLPGARWTGVDASEAMLGRARERLPEAELLVARLEDPLPPGPFDLVVSTLAVHHLEAAAKRDLFARVAGVLRPGGRFVLGDVVVPSAGRCRADRHRRGDGRPGHGRRSGRLAARGRLRRGGYGGAGRSRRDPRRSRASDRLSRSVGRESAGEVPGNRDERVTVARIA